MPKKPKSAERNKVLTNQDREDLASSRRAAAARGATIKVHGYDRKVYQLSGHGRTLARWEDVEVSVFRLLSQVEREADGKKRGVVPAADKYKGLKVVALLEDGLRL